MTKKEYKELQEFKERPWSNGVTQPSTFHLSLFTFH
jgi:hypothetical protein